MLRKTTHIFDYFKKDDFDFDLIGTRFQNDTLIVFYNEYSISIERLFYIINTTGVVTLNDFKGKIF